MYIYPALKLNMGSWEYFVVKMKMSEAAKEIKFAAELKDNHGGDESLDQQIQRILKTSRSEQIVKYLQTNKDRFFNSLVVAAFKGNPTFTPVSIESTPELSIFRTHLEGAFGALSMGDDVEIYALDGQHRLKGIKILAEEGNPGQNQMNETISVIFVTQPQNTERSEFLKSHRRLFSALNRNAKPTDVATNIIMDEDDRFAIATRRMISAHESFQWISTSEKPPKVDLQLTTESMPTSNKSLTNIISFYKWNIELLWDEDFSREHGTSTGSGFKKLIQSTPTDEEIDDLTDYLGRIWDALHRILPDLDNDGSKMRASNPNEQEREEGYRSNLLFRPICQGPMIGRLARRLMTEKGINNSSSEDDIMKSLNPLSKIPLDLHHGLYKYLLITDFENPEIFKMRSESRSLCVKKAYEILLWLVGLEELGEADIDKLQADWGGLLLEAQSPQYESDVWEELISLRTEIVS